MDALPDRAPPELEPGVTLDSLVTLGDCDGVLDRLTMAIASIEEQLIRRKGSPNQPADWRTRTEKALRIKKFLSPRVQQRRAEIARKLKEDQHVAGVQAARQARISKERTLLSIAREIAPDVMARIHDLAVERHPDMFGPDRDGA